MSETNRVDSIADRLDGIKLEEESDPRIKLKRWLGTPFQIELSDGRIIVGVFGCTDRDANIILESAWEYCSWDEEKIDAKTKYTANNEPRMLGLAMIPGKHVKSIAVMYNNQ